MQIIELALFRKIIYTFYKRIRLDNIFIHLSENMYITNKHNNISEQVDFTLRTSQSITYYSNLCLKYSDLS
jgi:hypothetical protein